MLKLRRLTLMRTKHRNRFTLVGFASYSGTVRRDLKRVV